MAHDFSHPEYLYRLARSGSTLDRESLAQAMTSLLSTSLSTSERGLAQDILMHLLSEAEIDLRKTLADQLADEPDCPQALLHYLIYENPFEVSQKILMKSEKLTDEYLIEVAKHFDTSDYWMALAQRKKIGEDLARFLIGTDDEDVYQTLVANKGAHLCSQSMQWLVGVAPHMPQIQNNLLMRSEVTPDLAIQLYWHVSEELRKGIEMRFDIDKRKLEKAMERIVHHRMAVKKDMPIINAKALDAAASLKKENKITSRQLIETLKKGDIAQFVCLWAALLVIKPEVLLRKMEEDFIMTLSTLCCMARITRNDYNTMFMLWRRQLPFSDAVSSTTELSEVMSAFDRMTLDRARQIINLWNSTPDSTSLH